MFREKYRKDNELLRAPEKSPEVLIEMAEKNGKIIKKPLRAAVAIAAACLVIAIVAAVPALMNRGRGVDLPLNETIVISSGDLHTAESYDEILGYIDDLHSKQYYGFGVNTSIGMMEDSAEMEIAPMAPAPTMAESNSFNGEYKESAREEGFFAADSTVTGGMADSAAPVKPADDYSATNTQKEGVDEADIIKTDGKYIYRVTGYEVVIVNVESMSVVSRTKPLGDAAGYCGDQTVYPGTVTATTSAYPNGAEEMPAGTAEGSLIAPDVAVAPGYDPTGGFSGYINDIYVSGDRLAVLYTDYGMMRTNEKHAVDLSGCGIMLYDIADRSAPVLVGSFTQSGSLCDSRLIGDYIYLISNHYVYGECSADVPETFVPAVGVNGQRAAMDAQDICVLPLISSTCYTVMTSVNIADGTGHDSVKAAFGATGTVYADTDAIVLAFGSGKSDTVETQEDGENVTVISGSHSTTLVNYLVKDGTIAQTTSGEVPGSLLNQFSIDRRGGITRVVTTLECWEEKIYTDGVDRYEYSGSTTNGLYTLDSDMNIIGRLDDLAEGERVYSVRFMGDVAYFVTFRQVDPLFAVDISNPANPVLLSALKIPGFSQYMHPYADGLLLGIGLDADPETGATKGLKLSMFNITDPADVTEQHKLVFDSIYWSEALHNHHAALVSAPHDIIAFPSENGYVICGYSAEKGFYVRHELKLDIWGGGTRGLFIGDSFYICTDAMLYRFSLADFSATGQLEIAPENGEYGRGYVLFD